MIKVRVCLMLLLVVTLVGCSQGSSCEDVGSDNMLTSDKIEAAELNDFWVENQSNLVLKLSNPINSRQIEAKILTPNEPIWDGEKQISNSLFNTYKVEILLHDIKPNLSFGRKFTDANPIPGSRGPIDSFKGSFIPDDSTVAIYLGVGKDKHVAIVNGGIRNQVVISIE